VDSYRTEEEQVEALKRWWQENGRSTIAAVVLALAAGFGWQGWQEHRKQEAENASVAYEEMLNAMRESAAQADLGRLKTLAQRVKSDYGSTAYAQFAGMHLARLAVSEGDLATAEQELRWVLTQNPDPELRLLAELRLARVRTAQGEPRAALDILTAESAGAYEPAYAEAEGDAWLELGETGKAIAAYEKAVSLAAAGNIGASEGLRLKLQALTPVPPRELEKAPEE
jgi:predicted negative regulator of RcsB-dependent stress response